jgi:hypothetical protein
MFISIELCTVHCTVAVAVLKKSWDVSRHKAENLFWFPTGTFMIDVSE